MKGTVNRLKFMVQMVHDLVFDDDGNATCTGADDDDQLAPTVGYHFGFYSRPSNARGVVLKADGQGNTSFLIGFRDKQYEISLKSGECGVKNEFGASTLWDKNGNVVVTPGGSGKVQLGGAVTPDAAVLGTTYDGVLDTFLTALSTYNAALIVLANALVPTTGVTPGAPATFVAAANVLTAAINAFKNASYLSNTVALK